jgi:hypothetical protein
LRFWCPRNGQEFYWNSCSTVLFFHVKNSTGIPVPVEKTEGTGILRPAPSHVHIYVENIILTTPNALCKKSLKKNMDDDEDNNDDEIDDHIHQFIRR